MESESTKTDTAGAGFDMRKRLASVIITEKATTEPSVVMNALIRCLQVPEISTQRKVNIYNILQEIIQQEGELEERCVQRLVAIASKEMRDMLEMEGYMRAEVASDTLVALSRNHFSLVMYELQHHLKPLNLTEEFVIVTLAKLANGNVFEFMPYMGITLATMFTMLRLANEAKMRQVICAAMETFCETVQFYLRHLEDSVYPVMTEDQFAVKLFPMYRYFVTVWLRNNNPEVKLGVIKSLKPMLSLLLPNDDLREQVYDYIPLLLAEYQGSLEALFITQVLRQILEMSVITNSPVPQMQLHTIFTELHVQVCSRAPAQQQYSSQNLTEIVHCFVALARSYPKELMKFFLSQMEMSKEAVRVGTLALIRAVVSADEPKMNIRTIYLAIRVVKNTLSDTRSKVRMAILRIIGQLALSGFQDRIKGWGLKYVSVQLTLSTYKLTNRRDNFYQRDLEEKMVHKVTMDTVKIITSSVSGMTNEFWVRLLCYIMETDYTEALTPICVSLTNLAERQLHAKDEEANASKSRHGGQPPCTSWRDWVLMSSPYKGEGRGIAMLNLLKTLSQSIAPSMADMWELEIPLLVKYLEEHTEFTWNQETWEDKLIQVEAIPQPEAGPARWVLPQGVILCFGLCARGQVKTVLGVLHDFEERIQESEQSWQIGAWRKDHPWRRETVKGALMVMYSCVASYCHPQMLLIHVDNPITTKIIHHYSSSCQDICLKLAFMKSVVQVTDAIKNIKDLEDFQFSQKATLTGIIMAIIKAEPTDSLVSPVRTMAMDALSYLSKLKPFYSTEESSDLMDISIHSVISLQPPGESNESIKTLYTNALRALEQLMEGLMQRHLDPKGLQEMVHLLEKWILSEKEWEREKAVNLYLHLMKIYVQSVGVCIPLKLGQFGSLVGLIAPGTCDSHRKTRLASMDVLASLLDLHASQTCSSWGASKELELEKCKEDLQGSDMEKIFSVSSRISKVACLQFNCDEVVSLVQKLCENFGAMDLQHDKASVTWICTFLQMRVKELEDKVPEILGAILVHLPMVDHREVRRLLIEGILLLAHYHQETVLTALLRQPLPMERWVPRCGAAASHNVPFARTMLHALMGRLQARFMPRANAASKADIWRLAAVDPLMTLCAIHLLVERMDWDNRLLELFLDLVYTLLLQLGGSQSPEAVSPVLKTWRLIHTGTLPEEVNLQRCARGVTIRSMQLLFRRLNSESLLCTLEEEGVWTLLESSSTFLQGVSQLARLCVQSPQGYYRQRLSELALRGMASEALSCRISSTAVCVEFMSDPILHQEKLLKRAVLMLEKGAEQEDEVLRVLSLRALGNMVRQYRKLLLEKCLCSLRVPGVSTSVTSEGLEVLAKVLAELREGDLGSAFNAISEQCRTFFDNESELLRLKAFVLFGKLAQVVRISKKHFFKQEVKKAWVPLMLHCQDPCSDAAQACVATMFQCQPACWTSSSMALGVTCVLQTQKKPAILYNFLLETMTYVKSNFNLSRIRIAACNLAGIIMKQMSAHYLRKLDFPLQLDSDPGVWRAALETLNILDTCSQQRLLASPEGIS
uniref:Maestro heat-like repeat-containing protein family member 2A n=1 Tax=Capra hircus TaxID=9925 RepID=A0A8C2S2V1_CAPHI